uniref:Uncharacterized protein n=1 Tax=Sphaerodactylus townsendi TaxID=933632 RepID=A0ACB8G249_9SAUR
MILAGLALHSLSGRTQAELPEPSSPRPQGSRVGASLRAFGGRAGVDSLSPGGPPGALASCSSPPLQGAGRGAPALSGGGRVQGRPPEPPFLARLLLLAEAEAPHLASARLQGGEASLLSSGAPARPSAQPRPSPPSRFCSLQKAERFTASARPGQAEPPGPSSRATASARLQGRVPTLPGRPGDGRSRAGPISHACPAGWAAREA